MNGDAYVSLNVMLYTNIYLLTFVLFLSEKFNFMDKLLVYFVVVINTIMIYSIAYRDYSILNWAHWGYPLYVVVAPFLITTPTGKIVYTTAILSQMYMAIYLRRCVVSNIVFNRHEMCPTPKRILPTVVPDVFYFILEIILLTYIWVK